MNAVCLSLAGWLADYYLLATVLLLPACAAWRWVRQPAHRLAVAWTVMLELIVLAVVCAMPWWPRLSLVPPSAREAVAQPPAAVDRSPIPRPPMPPMPAIGSGASTAPPAGETLEPAALPAVTPALPWRVWLAAGYLAGAALAGLWLAWGAAAAMRVCRRARPAADSLRAELSQVVSGAAPEPRLLVSPRLDNAVAIGVLRPAILLPAELADAGPADTLRAVLAHEWAHIRNRDLWLLAVGRCLLPLLFAHPLLWWLRRAVRDDQEWLADAAAAAGNRPAYAEELLRLVRISAAPPRRRFGSLVPSAVGIWENSSQLSRRITMLLDESRRIELTCSRRWACRALGLLVLLGAAASLVTLRPARSAEEPAATVIAAQSKPEVKPDTKTDTETATLDLTAAYYDSATVSGTTTVLSFGESSSMNLPDDAICLPPPCGGVPYIQKKLKLTAEQKKKLHELSVKFVDDAKKLMKNGAKLSQEEIQKRAKQEADGIGKQAEAVMTPEQVAVLKDFNFHIEVSGRLCDPQLVGKLGITKEQAEKLKQLSLDMQASSAKKEETTRSDVADKLLGVLTASQREQFRQELFRAGPRDFNLVTAVVLERGKAGGRESMRFLPHSWAAVRRESEKLPSLTDAEWQQVTDAQNNLSKQGEDLGRKLKDLSPPELEKRRSELREKAGEMATDFRKRLRAALTPQQMEAFDTMAVKDTAVEFVFAQDPDMLKKLALDERQKAALRRIKEDWLEGFQQTFFEIGKKSMQLLTPDQQKRLREEIERGQP